MIGKPRLKPPPVDLVEFFDADQIEQGSDEWREMRRAIPTASCFADIMAEGDGKSRKNYLNKLAGEIMTGEAAEDFTNGAMLRGKEQEPEARAWYERTRFIDVKQVGFVRRTVRCPLGEDFMIGCSPDGQVGPRKGVEFKTEKPQLLIPRLERGAAGFPTEHRWQLIGTMWVCGWDEMDIVIFYRGMPANAVFTLKRDDALIAQLRNKVEIFNYDLQQLVAKIRKMGT